ncbi:MAG: HEAT repeat domain-containing protein, partial [Planctomycetia bacterium]|nr:HEAT repeat domain-containing protein [Planctomycetia bacterium]
SQHYFGAQAVSADYAGRFAEQLSAGIGQSQTATEKPAPPVCIFAQGTSGDQMWMDYGRPKSSITLNQYADHLAEIALKAYGNIQFRDGLDLAMTERTLNVRRRVPDAERLAWAQAIIKKMGSRTIPATIQEVYAQEAIHLHDVPAVDIKLQAIRIGELGIAAWPDEVFAISGLKLKSQSPLPTTLNIELANGAFGYIPPPEQHRLGGYTTWPARSAGLEEQAEPKILEALLSMLEEVSGKPRRKMVDPVSAYARAVLAAMPAAYWRLGDITSPEARDAVGGSSAMYEPGAALYLDGPAGRGLITGERANRAAHFAGGRVRGAVPGVGKSYSVELWFWNGLPNDARPITGYFFSRGPEGRIDAPGDHLGIMGTFHPGARGCLFFFNGNGSNQTLVGTTPLVPRTWHHVAMVRDGEQVRVYLDGRETPEIVGAVTEGAGSTAEQVFIGGRNDNFANFEGKLDEVAIYTRTLKPAEVAAHFQAAGFTPEPAAPPPKKSTLPPPGVSDLTPAQSLAKLHVHPGFQVELVAAEPMVMDPVAIAWGPDGRLWVAEMADYPLGEENQGRPGGRIRVLEDTDGDGKYDRSTVFLDHVNMPTGLLPWRNGVLVTAAPEIVFAADRDGDGKADERTVLYRGFKEGNPQLRVNGPNYGLDNWLYCANGWSGGNVTSLKTGAKLDMGTRDLRIRPDSGAMEPESGPTQFGRNQGDWGDWFGVNNSYPMWHYVLADRYLRRNPHVAVVTPIRQTVRPANPKVYPMRPPDKRYHNFQEAGHFTSACQSIIYRDELLYPRESGLHAFICEPAHNLVHHELVTDDGVAFAAHRPADEATSEFIASEDGWCRPVMARTGPDGALWVVDMYRRVIEHPQWLPAEGQRELSPYYRDGATQGRIYRVFPVGKKPRPIPRLDKLSLVELVAALDSPNGWQRDMVQQMLVWRGDKAAVGPLEKLAADSGNPLARMHAICTLDGLDALQPTVLLHALADSVPGVRRQAVRLCESRAADAPELVPAAIRLADDPDLRVRLQLACSLGEWDQPGTGAALAKIAMSRPGDLYFNEAVLSSITRNNVGELLAGLTEAHDQSMVDVELLAQTCRTAAALGADANLTSATLAVLNLPAAEQARQIRVLAVVLDVLEERHKSLEKLAAPRGTIDVLMPRAVAMLDSARAIWSDPQAPVTTRIEAVKLAARRPDQRAEEIRSLGALLVPQTPPELQLAAIERLARQSEPEVAALLLAPWKGFGPACREAVLSTVLSRDSWQATLLDRVADKTVPAGDLDAASRQRLLTLKNGALRKRAAEILKQSGNTDRAKVVERYHPVLSRPANPTRGLAVFTQRCAACHQLAGVGRVIGADLAALTDKSPENILTSILDPNRAVESRFVVYLATTQDGRVISGIMKSDTGTSITLLGPDGNPQVLRRNELESLESTSKSLMPEGLERDMSEQDLADVISFVRDPAAGKAGK